MSPDPRHTGEMPFLEHLEELRFVLMHVVAAASVGAVLGYLEASPEEAARLGLEGLSPTEPSGDGEAAAGDDDLGHT